MKIERKWAMPSKNTFTIKPIEKLLKEEIDKNMVVVDPFCGNYSPANKILRGLTNDLNETITATYHLDALLFLKRQVEDNYADVVLFDPPFSPRQIAEQYKNVGLDTQKGKLTRSSFYSNLKDEIKRIVKPGGKAICCGWNSNGIGKNRGFELKKILLVAHGNNHNDTIVIVEKKVQNTIILRRGEAGL